MPACLFVDTCCLIKPAHGTPFSQAEVPIMAAIPHKARHTCCWALRQSLPRPRQSGQPCGLRAGHPRWLWTGPCLQAPPEAAVQLPPPARGKIAWYGLAMAAFNQHEPSIFCMPPHLCCLMHARHTILPMHAHNVALLSMPAPFHHDLDHEHS